MEKVLHHSLLFLGATHAASHIGNHVRLILGPTPSHRVLLKITVQKLVRVKLRAVSREVKRPINVPIGNGWYLYWAQT